MWALAAAAGLILAAVTVAVASAPQRDRVAAGPAGPLTPTASVPRSPFARVVPRLGPAQVVETDDVGDPFILTTPHGAGGDPTARYVLFWTTDWQSNVPTALSSDLVHWHRVADALPVLPSWATPNRTMTWAPSAMRAGGGWVLYYSTQEAASGRECIGAAFATDPAGPYLDSSSQPLICQRQLGGSIDPSVVMGAPGGPHLVWKSDGNSIGAPVGIWEQALDPDGLRLVGSPQRLLAAEEAWQHGIIEGPAMLAATTGGWWLFYSGGSWQSNSYATGVAWCATVAGPCQETAARPFLAGLPSAVSPGGLETFRDLAGHLWASYSAFPSRPADAEAAMAENRVLEIAPIVSH